MPKWNDFGNLWSTMREVDVGAIRTEAERPWSIACVGQTASIDTINTLLHTGADRYGPTGIDPVELIPLEHAADRAAAIRNASVVVLALDTTAPLPSEQATALAQFDRLGVPALVVLLGGATLPQGATLPRSIAASTLILPDPTALNAPDKLATALLERLPAELHLAAARRLPGIRNSYTRELINSSSFTNATYALASGLPQQIPIVSVPFAVTDMVILTKNQAIMVYRMALAHGAPPEFQERLREVAPVIGGAFVWRQLARTLIGLVPIWGLVPKVAIAYAGTYTTGTAAWRWFAYGEILSTSQMQRISAQAIQIGRTRAAELVDRARQMAPKRKLDANGAPLQLPEPAESATAKPGLRERIARLIPRRITPFAPIKRKNK